MDSRRKGIAFALLASLMYALKSASIKSAPPLKIELIVLFRYLFDFVFLAPFFFKNKIRLSTKKLPKYTLRALCAITTSCCSAYGLRHLSLADALLLENTMPLFIPLVAWIWYGDKITPTSWVLLSLGFFSLFFLLQPQLHILKIASLASLGVGFLSAILTVSIKVFSKTESPLSLYFHFNILSGALTLCLCLLSWEGIPHIPLPFWPPLLFNSLFGMGFQYCTIQAYSLISPHIAGSFAYFSILFSAILGPWMWNESLHPFHLLGGGLLILSGLLMTLKNKESQASSTNREADI